MANFHGTMKMISRQGGKSCVAALAYRSATKLEDQRTGQVWDYTQKGFVGHVEIMAPEGAPQWIRPLSKPRILIHGVVKNLFVILMYSHVHSGHS